MPRLSSTSKAEVEISIVRVLEEHLTRELQTLRPG